MSDLGKRIEKARILAGLNQDELAEKIGLTQQAISRIEEGITKNPRKLKAIADALNVSVNFLVSGELEFIDSYRTDTKKGNNIKRAIELMSILTTTQLDESICFMEEIAKRNEEIVLELGTVIARKITLENNNNNHHAPA